MVSQNDHRTHAAKRRWQTRPRPAAGRDPRCSSRPDSRHRKDALAAARTLLADGHANPQQQIVWLRHRSQRGQRRLHLRAATPTPAAHFPATFKVGAQSAASLVRSAGRPRYSVNLACTLSQPFIAPPLPEVRQTRREPGKRVAKRAGAVRIAFKQARPRTSRDFTVPRFTPCYLRHIFVNKSLDIAQDQRTAVWLGNLPQCRLLYQALFSA